MIKLTDLLKEIEQDRIDELGAKDALIGLAALAGVGGMKAQAAAPKAPTAITQTDTTTRTYTKEDGIIGSVTSTLKFPLSIKTTINIHPATRGVAQTSDTTREFKGFDNFNKLVGTSGINSTQMGQWNDFVDWLQSNGLSGSIKMDKGGFDKKVLGFYKEKHPDFWINGEDEITEVQQLFKQYRENSIAAWENPQKAIRLGIKPGGIIIDGKKMDPTNPDDVKTVKNQWMRQVKDI